MQKHSMDDVEYHTVEGKQNFASLCNYQISGLIFTDQRLVSKTQKPLNITKERNCNPFLQEKTMDEDHLRLDWSPSMFFTWMADCCSIKGSVVIATSLSPSAKLTARAGDSKLKECSWTPVSQSHSFTDWSAEPVINRVVSPAQNSSENSRQQLN